MFQLASTLQQAVYECDYSQYLQTDSHETDSGMQEEKTQNAWYPYYFIHTTTTTTTSLVTDQSLIPEFRSWKEERLSTWLSTRETQHTFPARQKPLPVMRRLMRDDICLFLDYNHLGLRESQNDFTSCGQSYNSRSHDCNICFPACYFSSYVTVPSSPGSKPCCHYCSSSSSSCYPRNFPHRPRA